jgi:hypothetical protein
MSTRVRTVVPRAAWHDSRDSHDVRRYPIIVLVTPILWDTTFRDVRSIPYLVNTVPHISKHPKYDNILPHYVDTIIVDAIRHGCRTGRSAVAEYTN